MIPIEGIMVHGMCPLLRPKELKCPRVDETAAGIDSKPDHTQMGRDTPENIESAELALLPKGNSIEVYKHGKSTIMLKIDPLIKKDIRLEWTYELSSVEQPAVDTRAGYESPLAGATDVTGDAGNINMIALDLPDCDPIPGGTIDGMPAACHPVG